MRTHRGGEKAGRQSAVEFTCASMVGAHRGEAWFNGIPFPRMRPTLLFRCASDLRLARSRL